jgi:hypothetical protein
MNKKEAKEKCLPFIRRFKSSKNPEIKQAINHFIVGNFYTALHEFRLIESRMKGK